MYYECVYFEGSYELGDSAIDYENGCGANMTDATFTFTPGTYEVVLWVQDDEGQWNDGWDGYDILYEAGHESIWVRALALPTGFEQVDCEDLGDGRLQFVYRWVSTSGTGERMHDLDGGYVQERVTYPGDDPFVWPAPWDATNRNPLIKGVTPGYVGQLVDIHSSAVSKKKM